MKEYSLDDASDKGYFFIKSFAGEGFSSNPSNRDKFVEYPLLLVPD